MLEIVLTAAGAIVAYEAVLVLARAAVRRRVEREALVQEQQRRAERRYREWVGDGPHVLPFRPTGTDADWN